MLCTVFNNNALNKPEDRGGMRLRMMFGWGAVSGCLAGDEVVTKELKGEATQWISEKHSPTQTPCN